MKTKLLILFSAIILGLASYLLYNSLNNEMSEVEIQTQFVDLKSDYEFIQQDLAIVVNDANFNDKQIVSQKNRIEALMKKNKLTQEELTEAKEIMRAISKKFLKNYKERVVFLEGEKAKILIEKDKIVKEVSKLNEKIEELDKTILKEKIVSQKKRF